VKGDTQGLMGENKAKPEYQKIRNRIDVALAEERDNLCSQRLFELTRLIDQMFIDQIKQQTK
jgi:hypothetical protein